MLFGLSNSGSNFCCIMEMYLGDQQFVTLVLYLDNICVFAASIDNMMDHIELVFKWVEELVFLRHVPSANPKKVDKVKNWPVPTNPKELQSFWG